MTGEVELELLILVIKQSRFLDDILTGFVDIGIRGATVVDCRGMGQILTAEVPIFSGLRDLMPGGNIGSHMIMSVVDEEKVEKVAKLVEEVCGDFKKDGSGVIFTLPVNRFIGHEKSSDSDNSNP